MLNTVFRSNPNKINKNCFTRARTSAKFTSEAGLANTGIQNLHTINFITFGV